MMSVSPGMAAGQAGGYFSREDYYLRENGQDSAWCGRGAESLGLSGPVGEEEFRALCAGTAPGGERLVAPKLSRNAAGELVETHRAGNDCTFSAPKSVSIAYISGVEGIKDAHDAAVLSVISHMEEHHSHYRSPDGVRGGGMVAAKFDHATSRNIDPQLHSHVFVVNAVECPDGGWRANEPHAIFQDQKSLGLLYRQALDRELTERGFAIRIVDRSQMFFELEGVDQRLVEHFSSRREEIERQVELWRSEGKFEGVPHARLYEMAALDTRDPKRGVTREEVARSFERGFALCGSSVEEVRRELEEGKKLMPAVSPPGAAEVAELAARDLTQREAVLDRARLLDQAVLISGGAHTVPELNAGIDGAPGILKLGTDGRGREFYTTPEMMDLEARNLDRVRKLPPFSPSVTAAEVDGFLERLSSEGLRLTSGQRAEVQNELAGSRGLALTVGDPGTAKSSTLKVIERFNEEVLRPRGEEHFTVNLAYTGKAARELSLATGRPAFTIDSFLSTGAASKFALQRANREPPMLEVAGENILIPKEQGAQLVIRVDEAGFLGARQAEQLLDVAEELGKSGVQVKLHLLGDSKQMQGILAGDLLRQLEDLGKRHEVDYARLTEILRQRDPGLLEIAEGLNREDRPLAENAKEALLSLNERGSLVEIEDTQQLKRAAVECYLHESRSPSLLPERASAGEKKNVLLVTTTNAARKELNLEIREARIAAGEISDGWKFIVLVPARQGITVEGYQVGDTLLFSGERRADGRMERWGARLNTEAKVTGLDRERNLVQVSYSFSTRRQGREISRSVTKEFPAAELSGRSTLYREEERSFSVGDRIVALKNDPKLDLQNGTLGVIRELDQSGRARVALGEREIELDLNRYRQIDHAYAVTIHKSQGATVEHAIMYAPVRPDPAQVIVPSDEQYGRTSYNALNVAVTRAQFGVHLFTNSVQRLTRSVELVDRKSSTLNRLPEPERKLAQPKSRELGAKLNELEKVMKSPVQPAKVLPAVSAAGNPGRELHRAITQTIGLELEK